MMKRWGCAAQAYIRPKAKGNELLLVSRIAIFVFGIFSGGLCAVLYVVSLHANLSFFSESLQGFL